MKKVISSLLILISISAFAGQCKLTGYIRDSNQLKHSLYPIVCDNFPTLLLYIKGDTEISIYNNAFKVEDFYNKNSTPSENGYLPLPKGTNIYGTSSGSKIAFTTI